MSKQLRGTARIRFPSISPQSEYRVPKNMRKAVFNISELTIEKSLTIYMWAYGPLRIDRQIDGQTGRQTDRQTNRLTGRQTGWNRTVHVISGPDRPDLAAPPGASGLMPNILAKNGPYKALIR